MVGPYRFTTKRSRLDSDGALQWGGSSGWDGHLDQQTGVVVDSGNIVPEKVPGPSDGLVSYFPLEGDAVESNGNAAVSQVVGDPAFLTSDNRQVVSLDGDDFYYVRTDAWPTGNDPFTTAMWVKTDNIGRSQSPLYWGESTENQSNGIHLKKSGNIRHYFYGNDLEPEYSYADGEWHHVVVTYDGTTRRMYIDRVERDSDTPGPVDVQPVNYGIGVERARDDFSPLNGLLYGVRVYDRALPEAEVESLYDAEQ